MRKCYFCGAQIDEQLKIMRSSVCPDCGKELKICYNCRFHKQSARWDCVETVDEPVSEKDKANFCAYFVYGEHGSEGQSADQSQKAKADFRSLFGD